MPSSYIHEHIAREVLRAYPEAWQSPGQDACALMGAHGPDLLFGYRMLSPSSHFIPAPQGGMMHREETGAFLLALSKLAVKESPALRAFTAGFCTHYAADTAIHPYVYAHCVDADKVKAGLRHLLLEKDMDAWLYHRLGHTGAPRMYSTVGAAAGAWPELAEAWGNAMAEVYAERAFSEAQILEAFADMRRISNLTYSKHGIKYAAIRALERLVGLPNVLTSQLIPARLPMEDVANLAHQPWHSPYQPAVERRESLPELMDTAISRAVQLLQSLQTYWADEGTLPAFSACVGNISYLSGLPCGEGAGIDMGE